MRIRNIDRTFTPVISFPHSLLGPTRDRRIKNPEREEAKNELLEKRQFSPHISIRDLFIGICFQNTPAVCHQCVLFITIHYTFSSDSSAVVATGNYISLTRSSPLPSPLPPSISFSRYHKSRSDIEISLITGNTPRIKKTLKFWQKYHRLPKRKRTKEKTTCEGMYSVCDVMECSLEFLFSLVDNSSEFTQYSWLQVLQEIRFIMQILLCVLVATDNPMCVWYRCQI